MTYIKENQLCRLSIAGRVILYTIIYKPES